MIDADGWWTRQFAKLLRAEIGGTDPVALAARWLVLMLHTDGDRRWRVSFELPSTVRHLLDDADIRTKDRRYAERQWAAALEWLNA